MTYDAKHRDGDTALITTLEVIEHLDFDPTLPCEHSNHGKRPAIHHGPGQMLVRRFPHCGEGSSLMVLCEAAWNHAALHGLLCPTCRVWASRDESWVLIERIGGAS